MILQSIALTNFKNIAQANLEFSPKVNCLLGNNGMGKSNMLDAIYFLSFTRSFGRLPDSLLIKRDEEYAILRANYLRGDSPEEITVGLRRNARKSFKRDGKEYKRISQHIGLLPAVMAAPDDLTLVMGGPEERRRFLDMIISQGDAEYLEALIRYGQALEQRNKMLHDEASDITLYQTVEMMMDMAATTICKRRREFCDRLSVILADYYGRISGEAEAVSLHYQQSGAEDGTFADALEHVRRRDQILQHTTVGPHRDEVLFSIAGMPLRQTASQGQAKSFVTALRFAQYDFLCATTRLKPMLLLDDL
ncbi:MAG: DNA replication/repair protein RecF, partial [Muribaculaceae bacterium]